MTTEQLLKMVAAKLFKKHILKTVQKQTEDIGMINVSQFGFCTSHSMALKRMRLLVHFTLNFK